MEDKIMPQLSNRVGTFTDSVIRRMTRISDAYGAINLSQGFPDFDPPKEIMDALAKAAYQGPPIFRNLRSTKFQTGIGKETGKDDQQRDRSRERDRCNLRWNRSDDVCHDDDLQSGR